MVDGKLRFQVRPVKRGWIQATCASAAIVVEAGRLSEIRTQVETALRIAYGEVRPFALMVGAPPDDDVLRRRETDAEAGRLALARD